MDCHLYGKQSPSSESLTLFVLVFCNGSIEVPVPLCLSDCLSLKIFLLRCLRVCKLIYGSTLHSVAAQLFVSGYSTFDREVI